ncbi:LytR/AlgR family response regulator transcription factor [Undibacterium danionis]|uniref:LytR/AlgR family response regulator transcription factor n=1 Tax=Undibacterium danionis TaxID=1812100 RepID=A0ABV6IBE1_9BURK
MTTSLRALIIDDEDLARRLTQEYLRSHPDIEVIGECENGLEAVDAISSSQPDLIFLDIQMPKLNGFEVLEATGRKEGVIFTTAYDQYALKAFDQHAIDYLLKPYSQQRFDEALTKARKLLGQNGNAVQDLVTQTNAKPERLVVRDRGQTHIIPIEKIHYIEAQDDYVQIYFNGKSLLKTQSLSDLEKQLNPEHFVRIHRSTIIRLQALKCIERASKDSYQAVMHVGVNLPISRSGYDRIKGML